MGNRRRLNTRSLKAAQQRNRRVQRLQKKSGLTTEIVVDKSKTDSKKL